jgi:mannose-6-phosphate isomerase
MRTVDKPWGREVIWAETEQYVGKTLYIDEGQRLSLQYHRVKDETILVQSGVVDLTLEGVGGELTVRRMHPGEAQRIAPGCRHRMTAVTDCALIEVSTPELDDVVRLADDYGRQGTDAP